MSDSLCPDWSRVPELEAPGLAGRPAGDMTGTWRNKADLTNRDAVKSVGSRRSMLDAKHQELVLSIIAHPVFREFVAC